MVYPTRGSTAEPPSLAISIFVIFRMLFSCHFNLLLKIHASAAKTEAN